MDWDDISSWVATAAFIVLVVALVLGINAYVERHEVVDGAVTEKVFEPQHIDFVPMPISSGKTTTFVIMPISDPDAYYVTVHGLGRCGDWHDVVREIPAAEYEKVQIGQTVKLEDE